MVSPQKENYGYESHKNYGAENVIEGWFVVHCVPFNCFSIQLNASHNFANWCDVPPGQVTIQPVAGLADSIVYFIVWPLESNQNQFLSQQGPGPWGGHNQALFDLQSCRIWCIWFHSLRLYFDPIRQTKGYRLACELLTDFPWLTPFNLAQLSWAIATIIGFSIKLSIRTNPNPAHNLFYHHL